MGGEADGFGALLRAHRRSAALSQQEMAERSGLAVRTISDLERGRTSAPFRSSLHRRADALDLSGTARSEFFTAAGRRLGPAAAAGNTAPAPSSAGPTGGDAARSSVKGVVPHLLPAAVPGFVGRKGELAALRKLIEQPGGTAVIAAIGGTAGVGKTALAVHWAHQVADEFPDGQLFLNLRGFDPSRAPVRPADAVRVFLDALDVRADRLPQSEEGQLGLYRSLLTGKRMLIVLDNARDAAQVRPLLPGAATCRVIVTSRNELAGLSAIEAARPLMLDVLTGDEARELLWQRLGAERVSADPDAAARIARSCARLPLALCVAAARASARPDLPLAQVAAALARGSGLFAPAGGGDPAADVRSVFSWSYEQLEEGAARVFRIAALHPGASFDQYAVAALAEISAGEAERGLEMLTQTCLVRQAGPSRFSLHDLLRSYAREQAEAKHDEQDRRAAMTRLLDFYLQAATAAVSALFPAERHYLNTVVTPPAVAAPAPTTRAQAVAWLDAERDSLVAVTGYAAGHGWPRHAIQWSAILYRYLDIGRHYPDALAIHGSGLQAARRCGDQAAEGDIMRRLGVVRMRQRLYQQAASCYRQSLALHSAIGNRKGMSSVLGDLGFVEFLQGHDGDAIAHLQQALTLNRESGDRKGQAHVLSSLGFAESRRGRCQQAAEYLRLAYGLFRDVGDPIGQVHALGNLGDAELRQGLLEEATSHLNRALTLCRQAGDHNNEADLLALLGDAEFRRGRFQHATAHLRQALDLCRQTGDLSTQAAVLNTLGEVLFASGEITDARRRHASALVAANQAGEIYEQARAHDGIATACQAEGNQQQAIRHWKKALGIYAGFGAPEAENVRVKLASLPRAADDMTSRLPAIATAYKTAAGATAQQLPACRTSLVHTARPGRRGTGTVHGPGRADVDRRVRRAGGQPRRRRPDRHNRQFPVSRPPGRLVGLPESAEHVLEESQEHHPERVSAPPLTQRNHRVSASGGYTVTAESTAGRNTGIYNDPFFNYAQFWTGREYEHQAEVDALRRLLGGRSYQHAADIGGGYGRLSVMLTEYANRVTLADPSTQQLGLSRELFPQHNFERELADAARLPFADGSVDLALLVRVLHHLPDPEPELAELARVLRPGGHAVVEAANSAHAARRLGAALRGQRIGLKPVDIRSADSQRRGTAPYVNHHPRTLIQQLSVVGLEVKQALSVSNFRHPLAKTLVPHRALAAAERAVQRPLAGIHFGPSVFWLLEKKPA
jgi:tetratricopeptide (TPR) repeat protein/SAM-dependent methyltransferase